MASCKICGNYVPPPKITYCSEECQHKGKLLLLKKRDRKNPKGVYVEPQKRSRYEDNLSRCAREARENGLSYGQYMGQKYLSTNRPRKKPTPPPDFSKRAKSVTNKYLGTPFIVGQFDMNGNIVRIAESVTDMAKWAGVSDTSVTNRCEGFTQKAMGEYDFAYIQIASSLRDMYVRIHNRNIGKKVG